MSPVSGSPITLPRFFRKSVIPESPQVFLMCDAYHN